MTPCPRCGNLLVNGQTICDVCGVDILDSNEVRQPLYNETPNTHQGIRLKPKQAQPPQLVVPNAAEPKPEEPMSKHKFNAAVGVIIAICVAIIAAGIFGALYLFS